MGTDFQVRTNGRFSNPENSLIWKYGQGTNMSGLTNYHCILSHLRFHAHFDYLCTEEVTQILIIYEITYILSLLMASCRFFILL